MRILNGVMLACVAVLAAGCSSDDDVAGDPTPRGNGVCLQSSQIDHTEIVDNRTILFFMKSGHPWKNALNFDCPSLKLEDGFAYESELQEICSNAQTIKVLRSGQLCELGQFTAVQTKP